MSVPFDPVLSGSAVSSSPETLTGSPSRLSSSPVNRRASNGSDLTTRLRNPSTISHTFDPEARERQRTMDVDMAIHLSRARRETVLNSPEITPLPDRTVERTPQQHHDDYFDLDDHDEHGAAHPDTDDERPAIHESSRIDLEHLDQTHDPALLAHPASIPRDTAESLLGLPTYQANISRSDFDFGPMEEFAAAEKATLGLSPTTKFSLDALRSPRRRLPTATDQPQNQNEAGPSTLTEEPFPITPPEGDDAPRPNIAATTRHRKLSQSNPHPRAHRRGIGGKMALFETPHDASPSISGLAGAASLANRIGIGRHQPSIGYDTIAPPPGGGILTTGHDRPYRFSFYSNALAATIHARSLSELPAENQTFEQLFVGVNHDDGRGAAQASMGAPPPPSFVANGTNEYKRVNTHPIDQKLAMGPGPVGGGNDGDSDDRTWWLDVTSPTDDEMKMLSKVFGIHPLTTEDIQMEETREKIELFRNYYLVCFRSFDQDPYSPTYLEPLNMYIIVFREGILSFHFRPTPHPQSVRRRIKQLKDYIAVTSDWISYALIDDITDAFGPLIQSIEYEVDSIDELVLILKEAEQSDMLRRIGTCRKKVMGLLRLMGNKADVVKGLAKRCNENWRVAPTSDIGLYLSDIQDHLITMTQNLNHYEKILSRSHSNYLAQISIEMTEANNQINDVLSKLTALGTVLIPMNLVTGLWGMNVHVPGEGIDVRASHLLVHFRLHD
ncbi:hypothetical protein DXG03_000104 [Asterophora parasitica]|uniref:Cora-domain-containing protein n=1 Tax=Asterophora parasitica TaxID=117018 RepID=A0A9P7GF10_9AGAR|nr:hypothetical protein DXG03_000104 [Asterophora parasitica]